MGNGLGEKLKNKELAIAEEILDKYKDNEDYMILYHSSTVEHDSDINAFGVMAHFGEWLEECLRGAVDEEDLFNNIKENTQLAFFSETPDWIKIKIVKQYGLNLSDIGEEEIEKYGQLAIVVADREDFDFVRAGSREEDYIKETYFLNGEIADSRGEVPFGVEIGDIYTETTIHPDVTLTGKSLVKFLKNNFPNEYKFKDKRSVVNKAKLA